MEGSTTNKFFSSVVTENKGVGLLYLDLLKENTLVTNELLAFKSDEDTFEQHGVIYKRTPSSVSLYSPNHVIEGTGRGNVYYSVFLNEIPSIYSRLAQVLKIDIKSELVIGIFPIETTEDISFERLKKETTIPQQHIIMSENGGKRLFRIPSVNSESNSIGKSYYTYLLQKYLVTDLTKQDIENIQSAFKILHSFFNDETHE